MRHGACGVLGALASMSSRCRGWAASSRWPARSWWCSRRGPGPCPGSRSRGCFGARGAPWRRRSRRRSPMAWRSRTWRTW